MNQIDFPIPELKEAVSSGILDAMQDWVRVIDKEDRMLYINKPMQQGLLANPTGNKCYSIFGRTKACEICICKQSALDGRSHKKEVDFGKRSYSVICSPVKNEQGEVYASLEVFRDITEIKNIQTKLTEKKTKLEKDLEMAKRLQNSILPRPFNNKHMVFSYVYMPSDGLGGDFLDVFNIQGNRVGVYIADVSGHGVSAAMLTMFLRSSLNRKQYSPSKALEELYTSFKNTGFEMESYITVFYAIIDNENRTITYSNAGHSVSPVLMSENGFQMLRTPGIPISNWVDEPNYKDVRIGIREGDRIFLSSDGIIEIKNDEGEYFGEERILAQLSNTNRRVEDVLERITAEAMDFADCISNGLKDDVTLCMIEFK